MYIDIYKREPCICAYSSNIGTHMCESLIKTILKQGIEMICIETYK